MRNRQDMVPGGLLNLDGLIPPVCCLGNLDLPRLLILGKKESAGLHLPGSELRDMGVDP